MPRDPICGMEVNEDQSLKLTKDDKTYYFCSQSCLKKFAKENNISDKEVATCLACAKGKWYKNKTLIISLILVLLSLASYTMPILEPFRESLFMYFRRIWWAILLGLVLGGIIDHYIPREYISHILGRQKKTTIFYAVIVGFFMSACSHGILALSIELHKKGASTPAVVAFLLASPWANFPLTIMLIGFFGLKALYIIFCALAIAVISGFIYQFLENKGLIEKNKNIKKLEGEFSLFRDLKERFKTFKLSPGQIAKDIKGIYSGSVSLGNMVLWWILIGMGLASLAAAYVPENIFHNYMGPSFYRQTTAFGNAFVFLMAGVVTDYTEIGLLWHNVGRKAALWLPVVAVPQVIVLGYLANLIF